MRARMSTIQPELTVVIPCYNESDHIEPMLREWSEHLAETVGEYEIVVVNDGSADGTGRILDKLRREDRRIRVIHQLNLGNLRAVRRGLEAARGKYCLQLNADGCFDVNDFDRLWETRHGQALVLGSRTHRLDNVFRRSAAHLLRRLVKWVFGHELQDANVPFRLVRREFAAVYLSQLPLDTPAMNVLVACLIKGDYPDAVAEVAVPFRLRKRWRRGRRFTAQLRTAMRIAGDILQFRGFSLTSGNQTPLPIR